MAGASTTASLASHVSSNFEVLLPHFGGGGADGSWIVRGEDGELRGANRERGSTALGETAGGATAGSAAAARASEEAITQGRSATAAAAAAGQEEESARQQQLAALHTLVTVCGGFFKQAPSEEWEGVRG